MEKFKFLGKDKIAKLPKGPGVYTFKKGREFLYIGKASNIRERVKNHFRQPGFRNGLFMNKAKKIGYLKTNSGIEALLLEANLIKKHQPKYNVIWRDDKNYFFVAITKEDFPRIFWTHQPAKVLASQKLRRASPKVIYIGPFVDGKALKQTLKILRKVFPYRSCKALSKKPCLWYQLGRCPAPCLAKSNLAKQVPSISLKLERECQGNAKNIIKILQGKKKQVLKNLKKEMEQTSGSKEFEKAAKIRDQIKALGRVFAHTKIFEEEKLMPGENWPNIQKMLQSLLKSNKKISRIEAYDISNIQGKEAAGSMVIFIDGRPAKNFYRKFKIKITHKPNDIAMIKETIKRRLKHSEWPFADLILIDGGKAQLNAALSCLTSGFKHIEVIALAKKKNELYIKGQKRPILLKALPREIFNLILQLRDEAHRFALIYHRKLREIDIKPKF